MPSKEPADLGRFTDVAFLILLSLSSGPRHGYAIIEDIEEFCGLHFEPGTLYGALMRLESKGWIEPLEQEERRRPYRLTAPGLEALQRQLATLQQLTAVGKHRLTLSRRGTQE